MSPRVRDDGVTNAQMLDSKTQKTYRIMWLLLSATLLATASTCLIASPIVTQNTCNEEPYPKNYDAIATIRRIHDGDTLQLNDGRKVRLIGINTPELARKHKKAEAFANTAKNALHTLFSKNKTIKLRYGSEQKDHYGRLLAHGFLSDGQNIQLTLLDQGLARAIAIPPNTHFLSCYLQHEKIARCNKTGLWQHTKVLDAKNLNTQHTGFHLVQGKITSIRTNDKGIWLNIDNNLTVGIRRNNLHLFDTSSIYDMEHRFITVRGWINKSKNSNPFYLRLRHPASIQLSKVFACTASNR